MVSFPRRGVARGVCAAVLGGAAILASAGVAAPAQAATAKPAVTIYTGGCHQGPNLYGFRASACDNMPDLFNAGTDGYIDAKPAGCYSWEIDGYDGYGNRLLQGGWHTACGTGHVVGPTLGANATKPQLFYSELTLVQGSNVYVVDSPYIGATL